MSTDDDVDDAEDDDFSVGDAAEEVEREVLDELLKRAVVPFAVWANDAAETDARPYHAATARQAAERRARDDYQGDPSWKQSYRVRDGATGQIWDVIVGVVQEPSFVVVTAQKVPMPSATHVLWGGHVLCEDLRLRGVPGDWPDGQRWISLKEVADGVAAPPDRCEACWVKAPGLVAGLRQIGKGG